MTGTDMTATVRDTLANVTWHLDVIGRRGARVGVHVAKLPRTLTRDEYLAVRDQFTRLGSRWNRDAGGFVFAKPEPVWGQREYSKSGEEIVAAWLARTAPAEV